MVQARVKSGSLAGWEAFVLRHTKPQNLALHFVSAVLFFGSPVLLALTWDLRWLVAWLGSGVLGTAAHYITRDGRVTPRQATSDPAVVGYNLRMWWRVACGRYGDDIRRARSAARAGEAEEQVVRTALVTGAGSGFGKATVLELLGAGYRVVAAVRKPEAIEELRRAVPLEGQPRLETIACDLADASQRARAVAHVRALGRLDCLVHSAAAGVFGALEQIPEGAFRQHMEVGFFGAALLTRGLLPQLRRASGAIVFVSSPAGVAGFPMTSPYCASKHALEGLAESLYYELEPDGVRVRIVIPSAHRTRFVANAQFHGSGALGDRTAAYRRILEEKASGPLPKPDNVARHIRRVAERTDAPLRTYVGVRVRALRVLRHAVPAGLRHRLLRRAFDRALTRSLRDTRRAEA